MIYSIKSKELNVDIKSLGAELSSIKDSKGIEYLWQADPAYWASQAPALFPMVGSLHNKTGKLLNGKTTTMERHGVVRKFEFNMIDQKEDAITFALSANDETKAQFPFNFEFQIEYKVEGRKLTNKYTVINHDRETMPYTVGGHPAFHCPIHEGEVFEDYQIQFEYPETANCPMIKREDGTLLVDERMNVLDNDTTIDVSHSLFNNDALVFDDLKSRSVKLIHKTTGKGIQVDFPDMNYLGVWSAANNAPFIALEPWLGMSSCSDETDVFEEKRGTVLLEPAQKKSHSFDIIVL